MNRSTAIAVTTRAVRLSRRAADAGNVDLARRAWLLACRSAFKCGGLSGCDLGAHALLIVMPDGRQHVAYAPVEVFR